LAPQFNGCRKKKKSQEKGGDKAPGSNAGKGFSHQLTQGRSSKKEKGFFLNAGALCRPLPWEQNRNGGMAKGSRTVISPKQTTGLIKRKKPHQWKSEEKGKNKGFKRCQREIIIHALGRAKIPKKP